MKVDVLCYHLVYKIIYYLKMIFSFHWWFLCRAIWKEFCFSRVSSEKAVAPHSSTLAWKIPWTEEPGSPWSRRVRHDWATSLSLFTFMHWRRRWRHTPVFLPGDSRGQRSLVGCRLWGRTESDTTEATQQQQQQQNHCVSIPGVVL